MTERKCGNCAYYERLSFGYRVFVCKHPAIAMIAQSAVPSSVEIKLTLIKPNEGTLCPCFEEAEQEEDGKE